MSTKTKKAAAVPRYPERKWGPFHGGLSVCVWLNEVENGNGKKFFRSVTISPRRYLDQKTGEWQDAGSLRAADLPALILGLEAAHEFLSATPLPGQPLDGDEHVETSLSETTKPPF